MKQLGLGLNLSTKKTRRRERELLEEMAHVAPWSVSMQIELHYPKAGTGQPTFAV